MIPGVNARADPTPVPSRPKLYRLAPLSVATSGNHRWPGLVGANCTCRVHRVPAESGVFSAQESLCTEKSPLVPTEVSVSAVLMERNTFCVLFAPTSTGRKLTGL